MLAFVKMIFRVRLYGVSRHEDGAKRNPNGQCGGETGKPWEVARFVVLCGYMRYRRDIDMANIIAVIWDCGDCLAVKG